MVGWVKGGKGEEFSRSQKSLPVPTLGLDIAFSAVELQDAFQS